MHSRKTIVLFLAAGLILALGSAFWLANAQPANAQCGSQASSCKNCHEVQGELPVNNDGTSWHPSHAFGDFCYICHAGNNQAVEKDAAHEGMVPPLSDIKASCQQCHPSDLEERAQVYATTLGVEAGTGDGVAGPSEPAGGGDTTAPSAPEDDSPVLPIVVQDQTIDYVQQYDESVLGKKAINWGNVILSVLAAGLLIFGGLFIYQNEKKLRRASKPAVAQQVETKAVQIDDYPDEVIALLPQLAALNPVGRRALKSLLQNPEVASELLHSLSRLDPALVRRVKTLDRESQALLMALAGD